MEEAQGVEEGSDPNGSSIREREKVEGKEKHLHPERLFSLIKESVDTGAHRIFTFGIVEFGIIFQKF
jgi:hypothetical protein